MVVTVKIVTECSLVDICQLYGGVALKMETAGSYEMVNISRLHSKIIPDGGNLRSYE
jgi:hypothetical protein